MTKEIIASGKDIIEAKENARAALGAGPLDDVQFEVIHAGSKGIFGIIGVKPAQVKAFIELPDEEKKSGRHEHKKNKKGDRRPEEKKNNNGQSHNKEKTENQEKKNNKPHEKSQEKKNKDQDKPKSKVIPESDLKLELRQVKEGEDMSFDFVKTVISDIGLNAEAALYSCEDGTRRITITGDDASTLIGHHGDTLDALQYLANLASSRKNINGERDKSRVTIDIEGYRAKREETLRALARRMAAKAIRNNRSVMLEPMSAYERRIIHSEIQNIEGVSTNSVGSDNNRKIVIFLTDKKPQGVFEEETKDVVTEDQNEIETVSTETETQDEVVETETEAVVETAPVEESDAE